jgi:hypothetical protein
MRRAVGFALIAAFNVVWGMTALTNLGRALGFGLALFSSISAVIAAIDAGRDEIVQEIRRASARSDGAWNK